MWNTSFSKQNRILKWCYLLKDNILRRQYLTTIKILPSCFPYLTKYTHAFFIWLNIYKGGGATQLRNRFCSTHSSNLPQWSNESIWHDVWLVYSKNQSHCPAANVLKGSDLKTRNCLRQASRTGASVQWEERPRPLTEWSEIKGTRAGPR